MEPRVSSGQYRVAVRQCRTPADPHWKSPGGTRSPRSEHMDQRCVKAGRPLSFSRWIAGCLNGRSTEYRPHRCEKGCRRKSTGNPADAQHRRTADARYWPRDHEQRRPALARQSHCIPARQSVRETCCICCISGLTRGSGISRIRTDNVWKPATRRSDGNSTMTALTGFFSLGTEVPA